MRRPPAQGTEWHGRCWTWWGVGPELGRQMPIDVVSLRIVIALGIIALAAHAADGRK
jgi:hypothetical protein